MAKRKRSYRRYFAHAKRRASKMTVSIGITGGIVGMPAVQGAWQSATKGDWASIPLWIRGVAGIDNSGNFDWNLLQRNATPLLIGFGVHKAATILGINRALGAAKIPFVRV